MARRPLAQLTDSQKVDRVAHEIMGWHRNGTANYWLDATNKACAFPDWDPRRKGHQGAADAVWLLEAMELQGWKQHEHKPDSSGFLTEWTFWGVERLGVTGKGPTIWAAMFNAALEVTAFMAAPRSIV